MTEWDNTEEVYDEEEELGSHEVAERDFSDHPKLPSRKSVAQILEKVNSDGTMKKIIRARKSDFVHNLIYLDGDKFSFAGRDYLRPVYDRNDRQILLKTARQVEKCQTWDTPVTLSSGEKIPTSELKPGDQVVSYNGFSPEIDTVAAVCDNGKRRVLKITTKKKRSVTVTLNHPFRTLLGWVEAKDLKVGRFVALPHKAGFFGDTNDIAKGEVLGHLLAEGHFSDACVSFTQNPGDNLESYLKSCEKFGSRQAAKFWPSRPTVARVASYKTSEIYRMAEGFMKGLKSATLVFPKWIYHADEGTTLGFLRSLWGGDGSCKESHAKRNAIDLCYSSTSFSLVDGVQNILLKFGIFSTIRENKPTLYKGTDKKAYILRVIGERSIRRFHSIFGDIPDKSFSIDGHGGKDQSDIIPKEDIRVILNLIKKEKIKRGLSKDSLLSKGLRWSVGYNTQRDKFLKYCEAIQDPILWDIYNAEIYWDEIVSIEDAGEEGTLAVEVERNHNFITGGVITHNTTFLANNLTVSAVVTPYNKALYVSPSHTQTRQFSNEKLRPAIEKSPLIGKYFQDTRVSTQVFEKGFTNGSYIFLRSAFRSADRTRGISCRSLCIDEVQDFQGSELPVIMECTSHFIDSKVMMAGTPKSFENPIEDYWKSTSQNEWIVKCHSCG
jgi:intein/homing endonuclease